MISEKNCKKKYLKVHFWKVSDELLNKIWSVYRYCINSKSVLCNDPFLRLMNRDAEVSLKVIIYKYNLSCNISLTKKKKKKKKKRKPIKSWIQDPCRWISFQNYFFHKCHLCILWNWLIAKIILILQKYLFWWRSITQNAPRFLRCLFLYGISTFPGYLMPNPSFNKNSKGTI